MKRAGRSDDPELVAGSVAHYEDPAYYAKSYVRRTDDVAFYVAHAKKARGPVLELGCGNGRITLPMARAGVEVVGVDLSKAMLDDLRRKLVLERAEVRARVRTRRADLRRLRGAGSFALVLCPFNTFLHLYTRQDVEQALDVVRRHLAPGGRFVLDVSIPEPSELARSPERAYATRPFVYPGVGRVRYRERFDYDALRQVLFVSMEFEPESGAEPFMTPLAHRQFHPQELEALLHYNGFAIESQLGDFDGKATHESRTLVIVAKLRSDRLRDAVR
jgi:SAM-dependent methyltransferase